jgi:hypothetical protein
MFLGELRYALQQLLDEERIAARPIAQRACRTRCSAAGCCPLEHRRHRGRVDSA